MLALSSGFLKRFFPFEEIKSTSSFIGVLIISSIERNSVKIAVEDLPTVLEKGLLFVFSKITFKSYLVNKGVFLLTKMRCYGIL